MVAQTFSGDRVTQQCERIGRMRRHHYTVVIFIHTANSVHAHARLIEQTHALDFLHRSVQTDTFFESFSNTLLLKIKIEILKK